jgi:hypothetical protein
MLMEGPDGKKVRLTQQKDARKYELSERQGLYIVVALREVHHILWLFVSA